MHAWPVSCSYPVITLAQTKRTTLATKEWTSLFNLCSYSFHFQCRTHLRLSLPSPTLLHRLKRFTLRCDSHSERGASVADLAFFLRKGCAWVKLFLCISWDKPLLIPTHNLLILFMKKAFLIDATNVALHILFKGNTTTSHYIDTNSLLATYLVLQPWPLHYYSLPG